MKSPATDRNDKKVNKSLQDRLRRDRISRSVEELRDLVLGPSGVHAKIGKEDILKLTVQYIRNVRRKELMGIATENKISEETENNRNSDLQKAGNEFKTRQIALTEEPIETAECNAVGTTEGGSDKTKARYHENVNSLEMSPIQTHEGVFQRLTLRDTPSMIHPNSITHKRVPFRVLDCNSKQATCKQTIWRPW
ncbi:oxysterol-binding protein hes1 [Porites harrisoni]